MNFHSALRRPGRERRRSIGFYLIRRKKARIFRLLEKKLQVRRFD